MSLPLTSFHALSRTLMGAIGVNELTSSSLSMLRRDRLSTMATSWPMFDRCRAVGQPQNPSPPRIRIRTTVHSSFGRMSGHPGVVRGRLPIVHGSAVSPCRVAHSHARRGCSLGEPLFAHLPQLASGDV